MRSVQVNGALVRQLRLLRGMTQEALAAGADCDVRTICNAEKGKRLDIITIARMARALNVEYAELVLLTVDSRVRRTVPEQLVSDWLTAFDARDARTMANLFQSDGVVRLPGTPRLRGTGYFAGKREIMTQAQLAFEMFTVAPVYAHQSIVAAQGSHVFVDTGPVQLTCRENGQSITTDSVHVFEIQGKRIACLRAFFDVDPLDELAGKMK